MPYFNVVIGANVRAYYRATIEAESQEAAEAKALTLAEESPNPFTQCDDQDYELADSPEVNVISADECDAQGFSVEASGT